MTCTHDHATGTSAFDVDAVRSHFPALSDGAAYFDGPGGSQTPVVVADAIRDAMLRPFVEPRKHDHRRTQRRRAICSTPTPTR